MIRFPVSIFLGVLLFSPAVHARAQYSEAVLPDAPQQHTTPPKTVLPSTQASYEKHKWSPVVESGEYAPPLSSKDKMMFWLHEQARPMALLPAFFSAGYSQVRDGDPHYGTDSGAFGERLGAAALRDASMRFFADSLMPTLTHEDPRYRRKGSGSYGSRGWHAVQRIFLDQHDDGHVGLDISDVTGRLIASGLTMAYYPHRSANGGVVLRTWGTSIGGDAAGNLFFEFWPDVRNHFRRSRTHPLKKP